MSVLARELEELFAAEILRHLLQWRSAARDALGSKRESAAHRLRNPLFDGDQLLAELLKGADDVDFAEETFVNSLNLLIERNLIDISYWPVGVFVRLRA